MSVKHMVESELTRETEIFRENLHQFNISHHKSHMTLTGIEFAPPLQGKSATNRLNCDFAYSRGLNPKDGGRVPMRREEEQLRQECWSHTACADTGHWWRHTPNCGMTAISKATRHRTRTATVPTEGFRMFHRSRLHRNRLMLSSQLFPHNHIPSTQLLRTIQHQDTAATSPYVTFWGRTKHVLRVRVCSTPESIISGHGIVTMSFENVGT
jgi:hypothetical protein